MSGATVQMSMSERTVAAGREVLAGRRRGWRAVTPFVGPAVIASVAYMDPGNFATNIQAGAKYGYALLWVVVMANVVAMLFQALSAKLGIVTDRSLAEASRDHFPAPVVWGMWVVSELAAMATDLAEFLGGAIGLMLLTGLPLMACLVVTGIVTYVLLLLGNRGFRPAELVIGGFVMMIGFAYILELFIAPPEPGAFLRGAITPSLPDAGAVTLAVGIIGATVMPHALYLHSSLTQNRMPTPTRTERRKVLRFSNIEVVVALGGAGLVNMAMVAMAAAAFHLGHSEVAELEQAYQTLVPLLGGGAAVIFALSLLASGFSSSMVGTMAGQVIMQDFVRFRIPLWLRRSLTMSPAFVVVALGANPTEALIWSQVVLSLALPVPMIALVLLTGNRRLMGEFVNRPLTQVFAVLAAMVVIALNLVLLAQVAGLELPLPG
ncbi:Mn(2(+))/Fe(2(+)): H(+) symporter MntH [Rhodovastum atsumiense]|uniref:Divalent metal cation transporter MntH n=1 Tax=Rhodovastum atsumiense TaxID=504468 RepID=A0A5M6ITT8_9PROT|nr:Nramp family divalent metal transporter [Rhodovastum atsumiense]KAA5611730.1 divalent metal cation transporter [Rhodovastum atsumiense]CAH2604310.1 Mn(2(+))/Fe(2(+)): H(+) symporter MntH [Rhodovastum atsumiense]